MDVPAETRAPADPVAADPVADGVSRALDPRIVQLDRLSGAIFAISVASASSVGLLVAWVTADSRWLPGLLTLAWLVVSGGLFWFTYAWPPIEYRHQSYRVDERGIEIRQGVVWRSVQNVPKSRVQHIDVSQGPLERRFGLGKLSIYTAGTDYALVALRGLAYDRALRLRTHLLPGEAQDAV